MKILMVFWPVFWPVCRQMSSFAIPALLTLLMTLPTLAATDLPRPERAAPGIPIPLTKPDNTIKAMPDNTPVKPATESKQRVYQVSCPALMNGAVRGEVLPPINDGNCGESSPLRVSSIGKVHPIALTAPVTINCAMAVSLGEWSEAIRSAAQNAFGSTIEIREIATGSDYQCRKVNGASVGRISEHAFANALDIMSVRLDDGRETTLSSGWNGKEDERAFWRAVHKTSCSHFMTVIGPDGDAAHANNLHLDQGCHGQSCQTRLCQ
ncbi:extensin [Paraburkholderia aspalathi]|nr:extensin [Paraburkholderia aspalathi]